MRAGNVITLSACAAVVVGLAGWLAVEHKARIRAGDEHRALEQQLTQMAGLIARNERLSNLVARANGTASLPVDPSEELLHLRDEAARLREQTKELETVRNENREAHVAGGVATADYWPKGSWTFAGYGTPQAALQTSLWATDNGDVKTLLASTTGDLQKLIQADLGGKSDTEASIKAMDEVMGFKSVHVDNCEIQADDTAMLTFTIEARTRTETVKLLMKKVGSDWKLAGPAE